MCILSVGTPPTPLLAAVHAIKHEREKHVMVADHLLLFQRSEPVVTLALFARVCVTKSLITNISPGTMACYVELLSPANVRRLKRI